MDSGPGAERLTASGASLSALHQDQKSTLGYLGKTGQGTASFMATSMTSSSLRQHGATLPAATSMASPSLGVAVAGTGTGHLLRQPVVASGECLTLQQQIGTGNAGNPSCAAIAGTIRNMMALQQVCGVGPMGLDSISTPASSGAADSFVAQEWQARQEQEREAHLCLARMAQIQEQQQRLMTMMSGGMHQQQVLTIGQPFANNVDGMPDPLIMASSISAQQKAMMLERAPLSMAGNRPYRKAATFPMKLMQVLKADPNPEAVAWLPDGKCFVVIDEEKLCNEVLDKTFKATLYSSFVRKLNRWGFARMASGTGTDCFHHPLFLRDFPDLCVNMISVQQGGKQAEEPDDDPSLQRKRKKRRQRDMHYQQAAMAFGGTYPVDPPSLEGMDQFFLAKSKKARSGSVKEGKETE